MEPVKQLLWIVLYTIIAIVVTVAASVWWRFGYWRRRGVIYAKPKFPFGNCNDAFTGRKSFAHVSQEIYRKFQGNPFCGMFMAFQPTLFIMDLELIKEVTVRYCTSHFINHISQPDVVKDPLLAKNLFMLKGNRWKTLRDNLNPAFSSGKVKMLHPFILAKANLLSEALSVKAGNSGAKLDLKTFLAQYTTDVIGTCAFGLDTNSILNPSNDFFKMGLRLFEQSFRHLVDITVVFQFPSLVKILRSVFVVPEVASFFRHLLWSVANERESKGVQRGDYLDYLISLKNRCREQKEEDQKANDTGGAHSIRDFEGDDFVAQAFSFYLAGYETSSALANFILFELAVNPEIQDKLIAEIHSVLKENGGRVNYETIISMRYLDMVVNESLRKYPSFPVLDRVCTKEYRRPDLNLVIPKGMHVMIPVYAIQRDPHHFPDPDKFDPERFSEEGKKLHPNHFFMPFGEGPRKCIGMRFALLQIKVVLVSLLSKVRFSLPEELKGIHSNPLNPLSFLVSPKRRLHLIVENIRISNLENE